MKCVNGIDCNITVNRLLCIMENNIIIYRDVTACQQRESDITIFVRRGGSSLFNGHGIALNTWISNRTCVIHDVLVLLVKIARQISIIFMGIHTIIILYKFKTVQKQT